VAGAALPRSVDMPHSRIQSIRARPAIIVPSI
jgi:hypothetical protein